MRLEYGLVSLTFLVPIRPSFACWRLGFLLIVSFQFGAESSCPHLSPFSTAEDLWPLWADTFPFLSTCLENKMVSLKFTNI